MNEDLDKARPVWYTLALGGDQELREKVVCFARDVMRNHNKIFRKQDLAAIINQHIMDCDLGLPLILDNEVAAKFHGCGFTMYAPVHIAISYASIINEMDFVIDEPLTSW